MQATNLKTIKWESVKSIFSAITSEEQISRAEISQITGLSLVTVGKVADALLGMDMITQEKQVKGTAGRRAGLLAINKDKFVLTIDLSSRIFRFSVLDLRLELLEKTRRCYEESVSYEENLQCFLAEAARYMAENYQFENCFGIGVSLPGRYDQTADRVLTGRIPEITVLPVRQIITEFFPDLPIFLEASENVAALSNITSIPQHMDKNILYWFLGEETTTGSLLVNGSFLQGTKEPPCDFGHLILPDGTLFSTALRACHTPEEIAEVVSYPLHCVIQILSPDIVILECEQLCHNRDQVVPLVRQILLEKFPYTEERLPEMIITFRKFRHSHRGLAMRLREMWVDRILLLTDDNRILK